MLGRQGLWLALKGVRVVKTGMNLPSYRGMIRLTGAADPVLLLMMTRPASRGAGRCIQQLFRSG
jgi:hypothetical protein